MAHFDTEIKHIAGKHLALTNYLSRNPISKPKSIKNYEEGYVINWVNPLLEFINNFINSVASQKTTEERWDQNQRCERKTSQSESSKTN